mmetsp:Transcript_112284/g.194671  ORF Transcript_112284/g.194671 Transcript_112284/m.194671 type:complete len:234 (+) Transcript_112284:33-734(+)
MVAYQNCLWQLWRRREKRLRKTLQALDMDALKSLSATVDEVCQRLERIELLLFTCNFDQFKEIDSMLGVLRSEPSQALQTCSEGVQSETPISRLAEELQQCASSLSEDSHNGVRDREDLLQQIEVDIVKSCLDCEKDAVNHDSCDALQFDFQSVDIDRPWLCFGDELPAAKGLLESDSGEELSFEDMVLKSSDRCGLEDESIWTCSENVTAMREDHTFFLDAATDEGHMSCLD